MPTRKSHYVKGLQERGAEGRAFEDVFAVSKKSVLTSSRDKPYLRVTLSDRTGEIEGFLWEDAELFASRFEAGDLVVVAARLQIRNDEPQLRLDSIDLVPDRDLEGIDRRDFLPGLDLEVCRTLWDELATVLEEVSNPELTRLVRVFLDDPKFRAVFLDAPAAKGFHHAYLGGLLEHTVGVLRLARALGGLYGSRLNRDLLLVGALFHDVGKVRELSRRPGFDYTDEGALLGHIVAGAHMVREAAGRLPGFPPSLLLQVEHLILSHHGEKEWGAPVQPQTLEAIALHYLDNLDAKLAGAVQWLDRENVGPGSWSSFWRGMGRSLLRTPSLGPADGASARAAESLDDVEAALLRLEETIPAGSTPDPEPGAPRRRPTQESRRGQRELF
ncbi:MAG: HD domain-containing protein [Deferrisomatales bacterium]|nr:HD domain-containing protein [Deferrisomatales bacterium]